MAVEDLPEQDPPISQTFELFEFQPMVEEELPEQVHPQLSHNAQPYEPIPDTRQFILFCIGSSLVCGLPFPGLIGLVLFAVAARSFLKHPSPSRLILLFFAGLTIGFIAYFPYQFFMLVAAAF